MLKTQNLVLLLSALLMALILTSSLVAITLDDWGAPYLFTSLRGEQVEIYGGQGIYQYDSLTKAVLFRGYDWANLFVALPLLILAIVLYRRRGLRGKLLLASIFAYFSYNYLIGVMGNAFNSLFLVWSALFSTGLFGLALILADIDIPSLPEKLASGFPRKSLAVYAVILGLLLTVLYLVEIFSAYASGQPPVSLDIYTTLELAALELALMIPLHFAGAWLLWHRYAVGYVMTILLAFMAGMTFISLSVAQSLLYLIYRQGTMADMGMPIVLAMIASSFSLVIFKSIQD